MPSAAVAASSSGNNTVVAAPGADKFIKVHGYVLISAGDVDAKWTDGTNDLSGAMPFTDGGGAVAPLNHYEPWFQLPVNTALVLNLSGATAVRGHVSYSIGP